MVKAHKGVDLSDTSGSEFGFRFIDKMSLMVKNLSEVSGLNFVLAATPSGPFSSRMAQTDVMNHPKAVVNGEGERVYYTESYKLRDSQEITLEHRITVESMFSPLMNGGCLSSLCIGEYNRDNLSYNMIKIMDSTEMQYLHFI
jgi:anaerobic ribonucleoside-triphosphate reductase